MVDIDPYQILGIPADSNIDVVREAYRQLATKHHPDKGGNRETFQIIKNAFKMIVDNLKNGVKIPKNASSTFTEMKEAAQNSQTQTFAQTPEQILGQGVDPNRHFNVNAFNEKFAQCVGNENNNNCLLPNPENDYRASRTKDQLLSEQKTVEDELAKIQPIFGNQSFDNRVFQRLFEQVNGTPEETTKALQPYDEPEALTSGLQPYTEIDEDQKTKETNKFSSLGFGDLSQCYGKNVPLQMDHNVIQKLAQQPDITDVSHLEADYHDKIKRKLNEYHNLNVNVHPKPEDPSHLPDTMRQINPELDRMSQQNLNNAFNRKMQERNNLTRTAQLPPQLPPQLPLMRQNPSYMRQHMVNQTGGLPVMNYPQSSNNPQISFQPQPQPDYFVKIPMTQQQPAFVHMHTPTQMPFQMMYQVPSQMPPVAQMPSQMDQMRQELQILQKTLQHQNKEIRKLKQKK